MSTQTTVDSFGLALPDGWTSIPTEFEAFDEFCNRARERWRQAPQWDRALERRAETMLTRVRHELTKVGCVLAAVYMDEVIDDTAGGQQESPEMVLMAAATLGVYTKDDLDTKLSLTPQMLFAAFARRPRPDDQQRFGRITNLERPDLVDLPAGRCVHLRRLYEPKKLGVKTESFFAETYIWPVGTDGETCCVLQFSTTNIESSRQFSELFGAIARTFRMFEPDQPTDFT